VSEKRTYYVDHAIYIDECNLVFLGKLGNWETSRFTGTRSIKSDSASIEAIQARMPWKTNTSPRYINAKTVSDLVYDFKTGYKRDVEAQWLNELGHSETVYLLEDGKLLPIAISGGVEFGNRAADIYAGGFTGRVAEYI
jgi:hypothetical protein